MEKAKIFVDRLEEHRENKKWSKAELARRANISRPYISQMESGEKAPSLDVAFSLAKALGCQVWELTSDTVKDSAYYKKAGGGTDRFDDLSGWLRTTASEQQQDVFFSMAEQFGFPSTGVKKTYTFQIPKELEDVFLGRCADLGISAEEYASRLLTAKSQEDLLDLLPKETHV